MKRRSLLGAMLAACAAPAYVKAGILMPVRQIWTPPALTVAEIRKAVKAQHDRLLRQEYEEGVLRIYSGAGPDFGGVLLGTIALGSKGHGVFAGTARMDAVGTARKAILTIPGMGEVKCDVGVPGSGAWLILNNTDMCTGMPIEITTRVSLPA